MLVETICTLCLRVGDKMSAGGNVEDEGLNIEDTHQLLDDYIDGVDTDLDKKRIKTNMRELMTEAQSLELA